MLNKNIDFNKNETKSEMENPRRSFRETNLVLQLIYKSQIKSKTVISWSSWKKKEGFFWSVYFVWRNCFNICVLSQFIVYWIHFQSIHTFTYKKTLLLTLFCFFWKSSKAFSVSFKRPIFDVKVSVVGFLSEIRWIAKWNSKLIIYFLLSPCISCRTKQMRPKNRKVSGMVF